MKVEDEGLKCAKIVESNLKILFQPRQKFCSTFQA